MLKLILILKAIIEVALFAYVGQAILFIMAGAKRETNFVFTTLKLITSPMAKMTRLISPRIILDRHIPLATFLLLVLLWGVLTVAKVKFLLQAH